MKEKRFLPILLSLCLLLAFTVEAAAAAVSSEQAGAAAYLKEKGIMVGDQAGNMNLDEGLTRAELAAVLTRLNGNPEHVEAEQGFYSRQCKFPDVPDWAKVYAGYCYANGLMVGYDTRLFGAEDGVTPAAACTVVLRYMALPDVEWDYATACQTAIHQGLTTAEVAGKAEVTRGDLAVMIYRALGNTGPTDTEEPETPSTTGISKNPDGSINPPADGSQYVPQVGDVIRCDDGNNYTIINVDRYYLGTAAPGNLPALPSAVWDGSIFPQVELPEPAARHFNNAGDELFLRNLYETRRMQYTLYTAAQRAGNNKLNIQLGIPAAYEAMTQVFWPWNEGELTKQISNSPYGTYYVEAWDYYLNGVFQHTRYYLTIR